eukprot:14067226-Alexandrium_andersonii.AAC.1
MSASLVGSEMCIRDSPEPTRSLPGAYLEPTRSLPGAYPEPRQGSHRIAVCLLYTSDAADDM